MSDVYITKASFKKIVKEREVGKDYHFTDTLVWGHNCGYYITEDKSWIFAKWEVRDLLKYKAFCIDTQKGVSSFYKKIEAHDSWRFIQAEQTPCYHVCKECISMNSTYRGIFIPEQIRKRALAAKNKNGHNAGQLIIDKYRDFWNKLEKEFIAKYDINWRSDHSHAEQFVNRINMRYQLDPPIRSIEIEEHGNSGVNDNYIDNRSAQEISDGILQKINSLLIWANESEQKSTVFNRYAQLSWLGNKAKPINNMWYGDDEVEVKKVLREIHSAKEDIEKDLKELYMRLYIPDLKFDTSFLESIGFRPCSHCAMMVTDYALIS